jgi:hypothetical protein
MESEMNPDDGKIWEAIDKLRDSQDNTNKTLESIGAILGERCSAREAAHRYAFETMRQLHQQHEGRLSKIELDVSLLGLTKARLVGFGLGLAAMSSFLTAILMKMIFGGMLC